MRYSDRVTKVYRKYMQGKICWWAVPKSSNFCFGQIVNICFAENIMNIRTSGLLSINLNLAKILF